MAVLTILTFITPANLTKQLFDSKHGIINTLFSSKYRQIHRTSCHEASETIYKKMEQEKNLKSSVTHFFKYLQQTVNIFGDLKSAVQHTIKKSM